MVQKLKAERTLSIAPYQSSRIATPLDAERVIDEEFDSYSMCLKVAQTPLFGRKTASFSAQLQVFGRRVGFGCCARNPPRRHISSWGGEPSWFDCLGSGEKEAPLGSSAYPPLGTTATTRRRLGLERARQRDDRWGVPLLTGSHCTQHVLTAAGFDRLHRLN